MRPKLAKSELVQARVDPETKRRIRSFADVECLDESDIVRRAIAFYLARPRRELPQAF